jgi:hypothetical protein
MTCSLAIWERLEPRPRSSDLTGSEAAPIRDPLWFLARQWQFAEFRGRDTGSLAYVDYFGSSSTLPRYLIDGAATNIDPHAPLERQTLFEPIEPDLSLRAELGQLFLDFLSQQVIDPTALATLTTTLLGATSGYALGGVTAADELNPIDPSTLLFLTICSQRALDGFALYQLGQSIAAGTNTVPDAITTTLKTQVAAALASLVKEVPLVFGALGSTDPAAWQPDRLEYDLQVVAVDPAGAGNATLSAEPNAKGEFDWYSLDVVAKNPTASGETPPLPLRQTSIPSAAKFPGMPNPRYWYIEDGSKSNVQVDFGPTDIVKLLVTDMLLIQGSDWFLLPFKQDLGTAVQTNGLVVTDVFGQRTLVKSANQPSQPASLDRFALFGITDDATGQQQLAPYFVVPPSPGPLAQDGAIVEDVRLGRDEMANMAWAIEEITESPIGEARSGAQRNAQIDAALTSPAAKGDPSAALVYQIESKVPANWTPLLGVQPIVNDPSFQLEKAAILRPTSTGVGVALPLGRILNPTSVPTGTPYRIVEEELPRDGLYLVRTLSRSRWVDGTTHLWVSRRRLFGAEEAPSGLRFDSALPNQST